jgi:hypothetical protein
VANRSIGKRPLILRAFEGRQDGGRSPGIEAGSLFVHESAKPRLGGAFPAIAPADMGLLKARKGPTCPQDWPNYRDE